MHNTGTILDYRAQFRPNRGAMRKKIVRLVLKHVLVLVAVEALLLFVLWVV